MQGHRVRNRCNSQEGSQGSSDQVSRGHRVNKGKASSGSPNNWTSVCPVCPLHPSPLQLQDLKDHPGEEGLIVRKYHGATGSKNGREEKEIQEV